MRKEIILEFLKLKAQETGKYLLVAVVIFSVMTGVISFLLGIIAGLVYSINYMTGIERENIWGVSWVCILIGSFFIGTHPIQWIKSNWKQATENVINRRWGQNS